MDREGIDVVESSLRINLRAVVIEKSSSGVLGVGIFRCLRIVGEIYKGPETLGHQEKWMIWPCRSAQ
jgi:hypothetical protein